MNHKHHFSKFFEDGEQVAHVELRASPRGVVYKVSVWEEASIHDTPNSHPREVEGATVDLPSATRKVQTFLGRQGVFPPPNFLPRTNRARPNGRIGDWFKRANVKIEEEFKALADEAHQNGGVLIAEPEPNHVKALFLSEEEAGQYLHTLRFFSTRQDPVIPTPDGFYLAGLTLRPY